MKKYFEYTRLHNTFYGDMVQLKAWKNTNTFYDIFSSGGHNVIFGAGVIRKIFPISLQLRHYPIRSVSHGVKKVFYERKLRFSKKEKRMGWHTQYKQISKNHSFIYTGNLNNSEIFYLKQGNFNSSFISERSSNLFIGDIKKLTEKRPILSFELCQGLNNQRLQLINSIIFAYEHNLRYSLPQGKTGYIYNPKYAYNNFLQQTFFFSLSRIYNVSFLLYKLSSIVELSYENYIDTGKIKYLNTGIWFDYNKKNDRIKLQKIAVSNKFNQINLSACLILTPKDGTYKPFRIELRNYIVQSLDFNNEIKGIGQKIINFLPSKYIALHARLEYDWEIYCKSKKMIDKNCYISPNDIALYISHNLNVKNTSETILYVSSGSPESIRHSLESLGIKFFTKETFINTNWFLPEEKTSIDQYVCEKSFIFIGNAYSSFSFNVRYSRKVKYDNTRKSEYINHPKNYAKDCEFPCDFEIKEFL